MIELTFVVSSRAGISAKRAPLATALSVLKVAAFAFLTAMGSVLSGCAQQDEPEAQEEVVADVAAPSPEAAAVQEEEGTFGPEAPDFTLTDLSGKEVSLSALRGQVVVLNFWATWCPPCREEIPSFVKLQKELQKQGVQFVGVSLDEEGFEVVRPFAKEYKINYPLLVDEGWTVASRYGATEALPTTVLINRNGQIVATVPGMLTEDILRPMLDVLMAEDAA